MKILGKRYRTYTVDTQWGTWSVSAFSCLIRKKPQKSGFYQRGVPAISVNYGATEDIPEDACNLRQYGDLTALWTEVGD